MDFQNKQILPVGDLIELGRADLVGKYVGWTAPKVKEKFRRARGSVLFIDEAYSLVDDKEGLYGDEAINTMVQEREIMRENVVVILAGYPKKMENFLDTNPGLKSRIAFHIPFPDYNESELFRILEWIASTKKVRLAPDVKAKVMPILITALKEDDYGNGRFVRNLFEKARLRQAGRLAKMDVNSITENHLATLIADNFVPTVIPARHKQIVGF